MFLHGTALAMSGSAVLIFARAADAGGDAAPARRLAEPRETSLLPRACPGAARAASVKILA